MQVVGNQRTCADGFIHFHPASKDNKVPFAQALLPYLGTPVARSDHNPVQDVDIPEA